MTNNQEKKDINDNPLSKEESKSICSQLIDFEKLFTDKNNKDISKINSLLNFMEKISSNYSQLYSNYINTKIPQDNSDNNIINVLYDSFYTFHNQKFDKIKNLIDKINTEVITPFKKIKKVIEKENKKNLIALKYIIEQLSLHQDVLNIIKNEYYEETKKLELIEKKNKKENNSNDNTNSQLIQKMSNQTKLIENKFSLYKKEVEVMKKLYNDCQKDFRNIKQKIQETEIKKNNYIFDIINNYTSLVFNNIRFTYNDNVMLNTKLTENKPLMNNIQSVDTLFNMNPDLNMKWKYDFDISSQNKEDNNDNNNNNENTNDENNKNDENVKEKETFQRSISFEELLIMPKYDNEIKGINLNYMELNKNFYENMSTKKVELEDEDVINFSKDLSNISEFFKNLCSEKIIQSEDKNKVMNVLEKYKGNIKCYIKLCDSFLDSNKNKDILTFESFSNFGYFSNLLKNIIDNISSNLLSNDINSYKLFDKIICIGEKSVYEDTYICGLLSSENQIFKKELIWKNSIKNKLINLYEDICNKEFYSENTKVASHYFRKSLTTFEKLFYTKGNNRNNIVEFYELNKYIKIYNELTVNKIKNITKNYGQVILHELIKCYIRHMINYNFLNHANLQINIEQIIYNILSDYLINDDNNIKFFNLYFISNIHSIKKPIMNAKEKLRKNITKKRSDNEKDKNNQIIIKSISKFLQQKEKINLLNLSRKYLNINNYIYHQILEEDDDFNSNKRIGIWKILLNYKESIHKNNYQKILSEISKIPFNEKEGFNYIINADVKRTKFKEKNENGQEIMIRLLRCLVYNNNTNNNNDVITYCQGMNFLAALFYDIIKNEEETFYLLKCFFINCKYGIIFKDSLKKLKIYFTILERLIYLYLPKIYNKLIVNQIQVSFFSSPYFVTLFTNIYTFHQDNANKFLLHTLDDFILEGWCTIFSTFICVLKYFEKKILNLTGEELIKFIVNDIGKSDLFNDENYNTFYQLKKNNWINNKLIESLEEEIEIEKNIKSEYQ
jgi:hypothetical protein